ncbi:MAG: hypothetical protein IJ009_00715 [Clostridia bacterium]|nr:hypothetical protein [Clostridia bacterium]
MKKILSLFLLGCMVFVLCACPGSGPVDPGNELIDQPPPIDSIPTEQYNFGGDELSISVRNDYVYEVYADSTSQEGIDPEIYKRNLYTETRFNFKIKPLQSLCQGKSDQTTHYEDVSLALQKNSFKFDLISMWAFQSGKLVKGMNYMDWRLQNEDGSYVIPYAANSLVNKANWWPEKMNNAGTVMGHQYVAISDMCITSMEMAYAIVYNYDMVLTGQLAESLGYHDMYDIVDKGDWTLDVLYNLVKDRYVDNPNGGTYGMKDEADTYGFMYQGATGVDAFIHSLGFLCIVNDGESMPTLWNVNQTLTNAATDVVNLCNSMGAIRKGDTDTDYKFFTENHAYFVTMKLEALRTATLHSMEDDYGILPYPKLNKDQKDYLTGSDDHYNVLSIPLMIDPSRYTIVGVVTEALAARTNQMVNSAFYDTLLKTNSTRNLQDEEMIDTIMAGRVYDLVVYHHADLWVDQTLSNGHLHAFFRALVDDPTMTVNDYWSKGKDILQGGANIQGSLSNLIYQYVNMLG